MKEQLLDIIKHTGGLGFFETVRVTNNDKVTKIYGMAEDKSVMVKGELNTSIDEFTNDFGLSKMNILNSLLNFPNYKDENAKATINYKSKNDEQYPFELVLTDTQGQEDTFRFTDPDLLEAPKELVKLNWNLVFNPSKSKIQEFDAKSSIYSSLVAFFIPKVVKDELRFYLGENESSGHKGFVIFEKPVENSFEVNKMKWSLGKTLRILKSATDSLTMSFSEQGALKISFKSDHAIWEYIVVATPEK